AKWAQLQVEQAVSLVFASRQRQHPSPSWAYSGGVALNAVANSKLLQRQMLQQLYIEPAAGDNGLALGCAYYGWLEILQQQRQKHDSSTCFGRIYPQDSLDQLLTGRPCKRRFGSTEEMVDYTAAALQEGKVVGWFQGGSEFGPRALGHRSILAAPFKSQM